MKESADRVDCDGVRNVLLLNAGKNKLVLGVRMVAVGFVGSVAGLRGDVRDSSGRRRNSRGVGRGSGRNERRQIQATLQIAKLLQKSGIRLRKQKQAKSERKKRTK